MERDKDAAILKEAKDPKTFWNDAQINTTINALERTMGREAAAQSRVQVLESALHNLFSVRDLQCTCDDKSCGACIGRAALAEGDANGK